MTIEQMLVEILAIKMYEHDMSQKNLPEHGGRHWRFISEEDREDYRKLVRSVTEPSELYDNEG